jgi:hemerythrin superfamily protein
VIIMAKATQTRAAGKAADAISLLKEDHRAVEAEFDEFENAADEEELGAIAQRVCRMLSVHAQIEEEILYPNARSALEEEDDLELVNEANVEHASAKQLIAQIESMDEENELFKATVKVLSEYIKHHVKEEEGELFPKLKKSGLDLTEMGEQLLARKKELMEELGLEEESGDTESGGGKRQRSRTGTRPSGQARH